MLKERYGNYPSLASDLQKYGQYIDPDFMNSPMNKYATASKRDWLNSAMWNLHRSLDEHYLNSMMWKYHNAINPAYLNSPMWKLKNGSSKSYLNSPMWKYAYGKISKTSAKQQYDKLYKEQTAIISKNSAVYKEAIAGVAAGTGKQAAKIQLETAEALEAQREETLKQISELRMKISGEGLSWEPLLKVN